VTPFFSLSPLNTLLAGRYLLTEDLHSLLRVEVASRFVFSEQLPARAE
jgi:hypothetical protein